MALPPPRRDDADGPAYIFTEPRVGYRMAKGRNSEQWNLPSSLREPVHGHRLLPATVARAAARRADDLARLGAVLRQREDENPVCVAAVRLLLLTG